jgi:hypothetical protein
VRADVDGRQVQARLHEQRANGVRAAQPSSTFDCGVPVVSVWPITTTSGTDSS